jgi:hypothetical protein
MTRRHGSYLPGRNIRGVLCYYRRWYSVARRGGKSQERLAVNNIANPFSSLRCYRLSITAENLFDI